MKQKQLAALRALNLQNPIAKWWQALVHTRCYKTGRDSHIVDLRALERNKYAPWGRGHLSGLK